MKLRLHFIIALSTACIFLLSSCKKELSDNKFTSDELTLVSSYVQKVDSLQLFYKLLERAQRVSLLNTYGNYTVFAPTDRAINSYLESAGKTLESLTDDEVKYLVDYHILNNKVALKALNFGIVKDTTVNGLSVLYMAKGNDIILNKVAKVIKTTEVSNGYVYTLDAVLDPPASNIFDYLVKSGRFTIMTKVFEQTGLKDTLQSVEIKNPYTDLNIPLKVSLTVFAESDDVLKSKGIASFESLKQAILEKSKSWTQDESVAMNAFARYHVFPGMKFLLEFFLNDGVNKSNLITLALNKTKVIHVNAFLNELPKLNAVSVNGNLTGGVSFIDSRSDRIVKNGVIHETDDILYIPNQIPDPVTIIRECENGCRSYLSSLGYVYVLNDVYVSYGSVSFVRNSQFTTDDNYFDQGNAIRFTPLDAGDFIEFKIRDVPPGKYAIMLNYQRDRAYASRNVNVYIRKSTEAFNIKSIPVYAGLDMANTQNTAPVDRDFNQKKVLVKADRPFVVTEYGDYTIRFAHLDQYYGTYDAIFLQPVN